uniref:Thioredoxin domain-containing protein n=1 Tax=Rhabditophanes sp. KR3021 TaxID=114890 RepID=A0AC35TMS8_9BILA
MILIWSLFVFFIAVKTVAPFNEASIANWIQEVHQNNGDLIDPSKLAEGEVLLFKTRKFRHRAVPIMRNTSFPDHTKFNDALTFKEWLRQMSLLGKALKVTFRATEVVKPVLQHLYASHHLIKSPIILHANVFRSRRSIEKPVDSFVLIENAHKFLPNAAVSLGWTEEETDDNDLKTNPLDWMHTFKILTYINSINNQPIILTMRLKNAVASYDQLSFLLGQKRPFYVVIYGKGDDEIVASEGLKMLLAFARKKGQVLFDLSVEQKKELNSIGASDVDAAVDKRQWRVVDQPSAYGLDSQVVTSDAGIAFIGDTESYVLSNRSSGDVDSEKQVISGRIHFLPKKYTSSSYDDSGMEIILLDGSGDNAPIMRSLSDSSKMRSSVTIFIGTDGEISISNSPKSKKMYDGSTVGKVPKVKCYGFEIMDKGWRVDLKVWTEHCLLGQQHHNRKHSTSNYETILQLETPTTRSRRLRSIAIGKKGNEEMDFILEKVSYNSSSKLVSTSMYVFAIILIISKIFLF